MLSRWVAIGSGSGAVQEKQKALLTEIIARVNELFQGDLTDGDRLVYVNEVIKGKLLESEILVTQAANNTKAQFAKGGCGSPTSSNSRYASRKELQITLVALSRFEPPERTN